VLKSPWSSGERVPHVDDALGHGREALQAAAAPVLELELEAAGARETADRRRVERQHPGLGDRRQLRTHLGKDGVEGEPLLLALAPGRQAHEHRADVRWERHGQHVEAAEQVRAHDAGRPEQDLLDLLGHLEGPLQGGAVGELEARDEVALVLVGDEAPGHLPEQQQRRRAEHREDDQNQRPAREELAHAAVVASHHRLEAPVEDAEEAPLLLALGSHPERTERGREGERVQQRDQHRCGHREAELAQQEAGGSRQERHRHEHGAQHQRGRHDGARHLAHRASHRLAPREPSPEQAGHVLHHDDRVVDHEPDGEHQGEERNGVDREAQRVQHGEGADQGHRDRDRRDDRGAPVLKEHVDHEEHQGHGHGEGAEHLGDRLRDEEGGVVAHDPVDARREALREPRELRSHPRRHLEGVRARQLEDAHRHRRLARQPRESAVALSAELDPRHVPEAEQPAVGLGAHDDLLEFLHAREPPPGAQRDLPLQAFRRGLGPRHPGCQLDVLVPHRSDHVRRGEVELREALRVEPDPHRVAPLAEDPHVSHAGHPLQLVEHVDQRVVGEEEGVPRAIRRDQVHHQGEVRRALSHRDSEAAHLLREARLRHRDPVLHVHRRDVGVLTQLEGDGQASWPSLALVDDM
jgi:hypothetical protein